MPQSTPQLPSSVIGTIIQGSATNIRHLSTKCSSGRLLSTPSIIGRKHSLINDYGRSCIRSFIYPRVESGFVPPTVIPTQPSDGQFRRPSPGPCRQLKYPGAPNQVL